MPGGIGLLGGTFDPVHLAHLRVAEEVREACGLDEIRFVPAAVPPHKRDLAITDARHRCRMIALAIADHPAFRLWPIELERPGPSFTIDTVSAVRAEAGAERPVVWILGYDQFAEFHDWRDPGGILARCDVVVVTRPPHVSAAEITAFPVVTQEGLCYDRGSDRLVHASGHWVKLLPVTPLDIASTNIRAAVRAGRSVRYLIPDAVAAYVASEGLYRPGGTPSL